jgi:probable HAF family extracellular repeat protein
MKPLVTILIVLTLALAAFGQAAPTARPPRPATPKVTITDLGTLPGGSFSIAEAVNARGEIVGRSDSASSGFHAILWRNGQIIDLSPEGRRNDDPHWGYSSGAYDINDHGQIVGYLLTGEGTSMAALWENGIVKELGALPGGTGSGARGINEAGQVVGSGKTAEGREHAVLWQYGKVIDLGTLPGGEFSMAYRIDKQGRIAGYSGDAAGRKHAVMWKDRDIIDLETLDKGRDEAELADVDEAGGAVGWSHSRSPDRIQPLIGRPGDFRKLTLPPGGTRGAPIGINRLGHVVGSCDFADKSHACIWQEGSILDLGVLPDGVSSQARDLNENDVVVGAATSPPSEDRPSGPGASRRRRIEWHAVAWRISR